MKKIRSSKGTSLAETLVTVLILSLVFTAVTAGAGAAYHAYKQVREKADAETLLSTSILAVSEDLYYAQIDSDTATGKITKFYNGSLHCDETIANYSDSVYHTYYTDTADTADPIVADKTQSLGLYVQLTDDGIQYKGNGRFSFTMCVYNSDKKLVDSQEVTVRSTLMK